MGKEKPVPKTSSTPTPERRVIFIRCVTSSIRNRLYCPAEGFASRILPARAAAASRTSCSLPSLTAAVRVRSSASSKVST